MNNSQVPVKKTSQVISWLAWGGLIGYLLVSCPVKPYVPSINFDDGWIAALNYLPFSKYVAGQDYVFTYGPLYFFNVCLNIEPNLLLTKLFYVFEHAAVAWILFLYRRAISWSAFSLLAVSLVVAQFLNHGDFRTPSASEYIPVIILLLFLSAPLIATGKRLIVSSAVAGVYAAILMFIKFDLIIYVVTTVVTYMLLTIWFRVRYPKLPLLVFISTWLGSLIVLATIIFKSATNCFNWLFTNLEHLFLYIEAADIPPPNKFYLGLAMVSILIYLLIVLRNLKDRHKLSLIGLALLPSIVLKFKHGFVLAELSHMTSFYKYILVAFAVLFGFTRRKSDVYCLLVPFVALVVVLFV